jgi:hypothetical protein
LNHLRHQTDSPRTFTTQAIDLTYIYDLNDQDARPTAGQAIHPQCRKADIGDVNLTAWEKPSLRPTPRLKHPCRASFGWCVASSQAERYVHVSADVSVPFEPMRDGQELELGNTHSRPSHTRSYPGERLPRRY